jgi:hypothetical protein
MSNLQLPLCTLAYMRRHYPDAWQYRQEQIAIILDDPPPLVAALKKRLGREAAHEALEASIDAGTMKFVTMPNSAYFGVAFYCRLRDEYLICGADGLLHLPADTFWEPPEDADGN